MDENMRHIATEIFIPGGRRLFPAPSHTVAKGPMQPVEHLSVEMRWALSIKDPPDRET